MIRLTPECIGKKVRPARDFRDCNLTTQDVGIITEYNDWGNSEGEVRVRMEGDNSDPIWWFGVEELVGHND